MNNTSFKQIPASLTLPEERKAEKALLFGLLASRKSLPEIAFRIRPEMFTHPDIALAIEAYLSLHGKGEGTDILSVEKEIRRLSPERAGQLPDLFELARQDGYMEVGGEFVRQHCQYIREAFVARRLILRCHELAHKAAADDRDTQKLISELGTVADELGEQLSLTHEIPDMPTATAEAMARVREIRERVARGGTAGIHTGLGGLDRLMGGLRTGSLHVFAARPGMGKTAFALFMAVNAAKQGVPVCVYSLEMSREQLIFRMLGQIADVEPSKITKARDAEAKGGDESLGGGEPAAERIADMYQPTLGHPNRRDTLRHLPQEAAREVFPRHHRLLAASKPGRQGADPERGHLEHHPQGQDYGDGRGDTDRAALPAEPQLRDEGDLLLQAPAIRPPGLRLYRAGRRYGGLHQPPLRGEHTRGPGYAPAYPGEGHDPAGQEPPRRAGTRALHAQRGRDLLLGRHPAGMRPQGPGSGA